jgi:hypothetical protein
MNAASNGFQADDEILADAVSDEALEEAAAGNAAGAVKGVWSPDYGCGDCWFTTWH